MPSLPIIEGMGNEVHSLEPKGSSAHQASGIATKEDGGNGRGRALWQETSKPALEDRTQPSDYSTGQMMLQPETRPITQDRLVTEVKAIYADLVLVETKCIEADNAQSANIYANKLNNEQWQALIALHRTLLHEHYDFLLASQHPSASATLRRLPSKYAMPARLWKHGIHSFLEILRHRLPASLEYMLTFVYLAYSMLTLLYEEIPAFEDTWIECLGDLGRYRMAIEDDDIRDRHFWIGVSRHWYSKASDKSPITGRLYHHLAILAWPNALQQLYYYTKSLCVPIPFLTAKESVMTLFDPVLNSNYSRLAPSDAAYVGVHGILFSGKSKDKLEELKAEFFELLDPHIGRSQKRWLESGYFIAISLSCALLGYGDQSSILNKILSSPSIGAEMDVDMEDDDTKASPPDETFIEARSLTTRCCEIVMNRSNDDNILPFVHVILVFMFHLTQSPEAMGHIENEFPWELTSVLLNKLYSSFKERKPRVEGEFPGPQKPELPCTLPEDYALRGLAYTEGYFPPDWFVNDKIDEDERYFELSSTVDQRKERILYLGYKIAAHRKWLWFDDQTQAFSADYAASSSLLGYYSARVHRHISIITEKIFDMHARFRNIPNRCIEAIQKRWPEKTNSEDLKVFVYARLKVLKKHSPQTSKGKRPGDVSFDQKQFAISQCDPHGSSLAMVPFGKSYPLPAHVSLTQIEHLLESGVLDGHSYIDSPQQDLYSRIRNLANNNKQGQEMWRGACSRVSVHVFRPYKNFQVKTILALCLAALLLGICILDPYCGVLTLLDSWTCELVQVNSCSKGKSELNRGSTYQYI